MRRLPIILFFALSPLSVSAKPIAFADAWTFMHERDGDTKMTELFYAPKHWWSLGVVDSFMESEGMNKQMDSRFVQANLLVRRWNLPGAQGNIFASYALGKTDTRKSYQADDPGHPGHPGMGGSRLVTYTERFRETSQRYVIQSDYETRQFYTSFKADAQQTRRFFDRTDTFQIGFSPRPHDYEDLAVWFIAQTKKSRGMNNKTESGAFLRLFKKNIWVEAGLLEGRKSTLMFMVNY